MGLLRSYKNDREKRRQYSELGHSDNIFLEFRILVSIGVPRRRIVCQSLGLHRPLLLPRDRIVSFNDQITSLILGTDMSTSSPMTFASATSSVSTTPISGQDLCSTLTIIGTSAVQSSPPYRALLVVYGGSLVFLFRYSEGLVLEGRTIVIASAELTSA